MQVYNSHKFIKKKIKYEKHSLLYGECTQRDAFSVSDVLVLACLVPREFCVLGARAELYCCDNMSTRSIRAVRCEPDACFDVFEVRLLLSSICALDSGGSFRCVFLLEGPYGLLYASADGTASSERDEVNFVELTVSDSTEGEWILCTKSVCAN